MNTAACLTSQPDVLSPELAILPESAEPATRADLSPPLREDISLKVPSGRDMEVYEDVVFAGTPQRQVAKKHGISQPRVHQILAEMAAWMADNTPGFAAGLSPEQQLRLVHFNVTKQLEHHQECLMEAWRTSCGQETVRRVSVSMGIRRTVEIERPSYGNVRYLNQASRVSQALLKLAGWTPGMVIPDAPRNSPYWEVREEEAQESGVGSQESEEGRQAAVGSGQKANESKVTLSPWEERAQDPNLTREEMDAITAEQEAVCDALKAKLERLQRAELAMKNTLSLGSGPLLPEDGERSQRAGTRRPRSGEDGCSHAERGNKRKRLDRRHNFLRGEPPVMTIRELIEPVASAGP